MKNEPQLEKILTEEEFHENTMGCFYQDELRAHDRAMRKQLATARAEGAAEERERIKQVITPKLAALESTAYEYPDSDYIKGQEDLADEIMQALTTKEHHAE